MGARSWRSFILVQDEAIEKSVTEYLEGYRLAPEIKDIVGRIFGGIMELAARASDSNRGSNPLEGILIPLSRVDFTK